MATKNKKMKIDPDKFSRAVVSGMALPDTLDDTEASKKALMRYLSAYFLAEKFNKLEADQFSFTKSPNFDLLMRTLADFDDSKKL